MVKIAYLVLAHHDPIHLERLVNSIDYQAHIFIHLDKKTNIDRYINIANIESVNFIPERVKVYWGGISMVKAILNLIKTALASKGNFSHLVLLSGSDYPIKPVSIFYDFLKSNPDRQFIKLTNLNETPLPSEKRLTNYWFMEPFQPFYNDRFFRRVLQKIFHLGVTKKPLNNVSTAWGSQWWAGGGGIATYVEQATKMLQNRGNLVEVFTASHYRSGVEIEASGVRIHRIQLENKKLFANEIAPVFAERHALVKFDVLEGPDFCADAAGVIRLIPEIPLVVKLHTPNGIFRQVQAATITEFIPKLRTNLGAWHQWLNPQ